jgi:hypothetical protein
MGRMSSLQGRVPRGSRAWRWLRLACVSLGLAAGGCLLSKVEFEAPAADEVGSLGGSGGGGTGAVDAGNEPVASGGSAADMLAQGGTGNLCAVMPDVAQCPPSAFPEGSVGSACTADQGCFSLHCEAERCVAATCTDEITNQDETDQDCGGRCALRCSEGQACLVDADCDERLSCPGETRRCTPGSCRDRLLNGFELLIDCGGGVCPGCPNGTRCDSSTDCASGVCSTLGCEAGVDTCCVPSSCNDEVQNGNETGVDCGGFSCGQCALGGGCIDSLDCSSGVCGTVGCPPEVERCCIETSCNDGVLNGFETSIDCGGGNCPRCRDLDLCQQDSDCVNNHCDPSGRCISCGDDIIDGTETDRDCGGSDPACRRCNTNEACLINSDCVNDFCLAGFCS